VYDRVAVSTAIHPPAMTELTDGQRRSAMRSAVFGQCAGTIGSLVFTNGLLLLYLRSLGIGPVGIMISLAMHEVARGVVTLPAAHLSDRYGIKRVGAVGLVMTILGYGGIAAAGWVGGAAGRALVVSGIVLYAVGFSTFTGGWFALLWGIVPAETRGRFFGMLRFAWQVVVIAFTQLTTVLLGWLPAVRAFQIVMALIFVGQIDRLWQYTRIPEVREPSRPGGLIAALAEVVRAPRYMGFCAYAFLLHLFAANTPVLFALVEKEVLRMTNDAVARLGVVLMVGYLVGFAAGGWVVDRLGTKLVFLLCHLGYAVVLTAFPFRGLVPAKELFGVPAALGLLNFGYGVVYAASTIAISTEMFALAPRDRKSLSTGLCTALVSAGAGLSGLIGSTLVASGMLRPEWSLAGTTASHYDTVMLMGAGMIVILVVTLGLVPAVVGKAEVVPKGDA
jgi:MFS family permease